MTLLLCFELYIIGWMIAWAIFYVDARYRHDKEERVWGRYVFGRNILLDSFLLAFFWPFWLGLYLMLFFSGVD